MSRVIVGILVSGAVAGEPSLSFFLSLLIMYIPEIYRDGKITCLPYCLYGPVHRHIAGIGLWRRSYVYCCLRQRYPRFRHSYPFYGKGCAHRHIKRHGIGHPHILRGADHDASCYKFDVLPGLQHPCEVIRRRIRIRASHALYECGYGVIVVIAVLIIPYGPFLYAFFHNLKGKMYPAVCLRIRREHRKLHGIKGSTGVAFRYIAQEIRSVVVYIGVIHAHAFFIIGHGPYDKLFYILSG